MVSSNGNVLQYEKKIYLFVLNFSYVHKVFGLICLIDMVWECNWCRHFFLEKMHFHTLSRNLSVTKSWEGYNGVKEFFEREFSLFFKYGLLPKSNPSVKTEMILWWHNFSQNNNEFFLRISASSSSKTITNGHST